MQITVEINNCRQCRHVDHSGSFTAGGARAICGHSDACKARKTYEEFLNEYPMYAKREYDGDFKYHWYNRIVDENAKSEIKGIPDWCPLKHGSMY